MHNFVVWRKDSMFFWTKKTYIFTVINQKYAVLGKKASRILYLNGNNIITLQDTLLLATIALETL